MQLNVELGELLDSLTDFRNNRKQGVQLNNQTYEQVDISAGILQSSIMGPLLFLIYINDFSDDVYISVKLFVSNTPLFSIVSDIVAITNKLNNDLISVSKQVYQWKMVFNSLLTKQVQEVIFSRKLNKLIHPNLTFENYHVNQTESYFFILDNKLKFN